jgi:hypothetical protein
MATSTHNCHPAVEVESVTISRRLQATLEMTGRSRDGAARAHIERIQSAQGRSRDHALRPRHEAKAGRRSRPGRGRPAPAAASWWFTMRADDPAISERPPPNIGALALFAKVTVSTCLP